MNKHQANSQASTRLSRREFMQGSAVAAGALLAREPGFTEPAPKVRVVVVTTKAAIRPGQPPSVELLERMGGKGVTTLSGKSDPLQAWGDFVRKTDVVALPTAGGQLENVPELNVAVYRSLARFGVHKMVVGTHRMSGGWRASVEAALKDRMPEL